jgi:hypothetical protein
MPEARHEQPRLDLLDHEGWFPILDVRERMRVNDARRKK